MNSAAPPAPDLAALLICEFCGPGVDFSRSVSGLISGIPQELASNLSSNGSQKAYRYPMEFQMNSIYKYSDSHRNSNRSRTTD